MKFYLRENIFNVCVKKTNSEPYTDFFMERDFIIVIFIVIFRHEFKWKKHGDFSEFEVLVSISTCNV